MIKAVIDEVVSGLVAHRFEENGLKDDSNHTFVWEKGFSGGASTLSYTLYSEPTFS